MDAAADFRADIGFIGWDRATALNSFLNAGRREVVFAALTLASTRGPVIE